VDAFERRTPQYLRIYRDLKEQVANGTLVAGDRLATQRELANRYGVTVMTVRQALHLLEQEELVVLRHGLGTFVAPKRVEYGLGNLRSLAQEVTAQGLELKTRVLRRELVQPHPHVAELLQVDPGEQVYVVERLRFVGRQPIVYQYSQLQPWLAEPLDAADLTATSLYDFLHDELEIEIARAQEWVRAAPLGPREAALLEEQPNTAALLSERLTFADSGTPIMFDRAHLPGDRVSLATERFVEDMTVGYELTLTEEAR
jgi:GntR family transcriptional regulator